MDNSLIVTKSKVPGGTLLLYALMLETLLQEIPGVHLGTNIDHFEVQVGS